MLLAVCLPGCGNNSQEVSLEITCDEFREQPAASRELEVVKGSTFTVTLCTSPTAGFLWSEKTEISNGTVLKQVAHEVWGKGVLDASAEEVWTFRALNTGNSTIALEYSRPWEIDADQKFWTLDLFVIVR